MTLFNGSFFLQLRLSIKILRGALSLSSLPLLAIGSAPAFGAQGFSFSREKYNPAILSISFSSNQASTASRSASESSRSDSFLDIALVTRDGEVLGRRVSLKREVFRSQLKALYQQLAAQSPMDIANPASPSRLLYDVFFRPVSDALRSKSVTALLISAEVGLQGVPFAALHDGVSYVGEKYSFSLTPSLQLTSLSPAAKSSHSSLVAGASVFPDLPPLPLVPQELKGVSRLGESTMLLEREFTPTVMLVKVADPVFSRVHVATHAEFLPGSANNSYVYTGTAPVPMREFFSIRQRRASQPIDLFVLSACRTALGDSSTELGFAGLAIQAGAKSAIGTLWYVDDVATSAYFVLMYRYLDQGLPKAEALQATRVAFSGGLVRLREDKIIDPHGIPLLEGLTRQQQRRVASGLSHPFFWSGVELIGAPW